MRALPMLLLVSLQCLCASGIDWVRPGMTTNQLVWGIKGGLHWAIPPAGFRQGEPEGLIRLGYPILTNGACDLVNFIAIEPIVSGWRGLSELEKSQSTGRQGKRIWAGRSESDTNSLFPGLVRKLTNGVEELEVPLFVERFQNGAHVRLIARQRSSRPDEVEFSILQEPDSASMEVCILTATMGNMARTRDLWLKESVVSSHKLYSGHTNTDFAPHHVFPLSRLQRTSDGDVIAAVTNDEDNPAENIPFRRSSFWHYQGFKVTQFWCKPKEDIRTGLQVAVNARYTYYMSRKPIPGGVAYENFEMRERFHDGQRFAFGITRRTPSQLGFKDR